MIEFGNYALGSDANNWIIYERKVSKKTGQTHWRATYFYFHLHDALQGLWEDHLRQQDYPDARTLLDAIRACTARVEAAGKASLRPTKRVA